MFLFHEAQDVGLQRVAGSAGSVGNHLDKIPDLKKRLKSRETGSYIWKSLWTWNLLVISICVIWFKHEETESFLEVVWGLEPTWSPKQSLSYKTESGTPTDVVTDLFFFAFFFLREGGTTTFLISYRTIRRWVKLVQIAVSKVVGSGRMRCFYLLFTSAFSRRPLSPIRDNAQQTRRDLSFPVSNCKPSC